VDLTLTPEEQHVKDAARAFLESNCPDLAALPGQLDERMAALRGWQAECHAAGFVGISWPTEYGGGGRSTAEEIIVGQEFAAFGAPEWANIVGLSVLGPAVLEYGTDEQRARHVEGILSGEEIWCQGFSEPDAGSDLAALRTTAVDHGDHYVVNGQKTWVSWGQFATFCGVLVRTDQEAAKHRGISMLIVDMATPGVIVRPMEQITGHSEFCELFFEDAVVPKANLLGGAGDGWRIAMHVVAHERGTAALPRQATLRAWVDRLVTDVIATSRHDRSLIESEAAQLALARAAIDVEVLGHHAARTMSPFLTGDPVGPESSGVKLMMSQAEQTLCGTAVDVLGTQRSAGFWLERYLFGRAASVYGGSQQIQRDIIADRVLALPKE
jgi:alkylation response protein AidB-like acyl-CoA dehydrogenase